MSIRRGRVIVALGASAATLAAGLAVALSSAAAGAAVAPTAGAAGAPGDNGTVKIHQSGTPVTDDRNEPHVCTFYLDAFGFDSAQSVSWQIESWPPTGNGTVVSSGTLTLDASGNGFTSDMTLPDGHYKLFWNFAGENGAAKHKVFWVTCESSSPSPSPSPSSSSPVS